MKNSMMTASSPPNGPVPTVQDLINHFHAGEKPEGRFRIGVEHEKIGVALGADGSVRPLPYEDPDPAAPQIKNLLHALMAVGWQPVYEGEAVIALRKDGSSITLEPGGQFELSGPPLDTAVKAAAQVDEHMRELLPIADRMGIAFIATGFRPLGTWDDVPWMPKGRYRVMREYLPKHGKLGVEMMKRTATVQANLDYSSEADALAKMRLSLGVSALVMALFAASPLKDGRPAGYKSVRAACWLDTDNARCGLLPFVFEHESLFRAYTEWALDVPMFFVYRHHHYQMVEGLTFRRFLREGYQGETATMADWDLHLSTLFPETRLKQYVEMRSADSGPMTMIRALPCLWRGLLYVADAREAAWALTRDWTFAEREALRAEAPRGGMQTRVRGQEIAPLCVELVEIAQRGLKALGSEEGVRILDPLLEQARAGRAPADHILEVYHATAGDARAFVEALRYRLD